MNMHSYQHNIKTFNNATLHLTRVERSLYRDLIELYYDAEQPLPAVNFDRLARRVRAFSEEEITALKFVLSEFFERTGDVYTHDFCDEEIERYHNLKTAKARAGKASAEARRKKAKERKRQRSKQSEQKLTPDEQVLNKTSACVANHEPGTMNQKPNIKRDFKKSLMSMGVSEKLADTWLEIRKSKKATNSDIAWDGFIKQVQKSGKPLDYIVQKCCEQSWSGFKATWLKDEKAEDATQSQDFIGLHTNGNWAEDL